MTCRYETITCQNASEMQLKLMKATRATAIVLYHQLQVQTHRRCPN